MLYKLINKELSMGFSDHLFYSKGEFDATILYDHKNALNIQCSLIKNYYFYFIKNNYFDDNYFLSNIIDLYLLVESDSIYIDNKNELSILTVFYDLVRKKTIYKMDEMFPSMKDVGYYIEDKEKPSNYFKMTMTTSELIERSLSPQPTYKLSDSVKFELKNDISILCAMYYNLPLKKKIRQFDMLTNVYDLSYHDIRSIVVDLMEDYGYNISDDLSKDDVINKKEIFSNISCKVASEENKKDIQTFYLSFDKRYEKSLLSNFRSLDLDSKHKKLKKIAGE